MKFLDKMNFYAVAVAATMFVGTVSASEEMGWMRKKGQDSIGDAVPGKDVVRGISEFITNNVYTPVDTNIYTPYVAPAQECIGKHVGANAGSIVAFLVNDEFNEGSDFQKTVIYSAGEMIDNFKKHNWKRHGLNALFNLGIVSFQDGFKKVSEPVVKVASTVLPKRLCEFAVRVATSPVVAKVIIFALVQRCGAIATKAGYRGGC